MPIHSTIDLIEGAARALAEAMGDNLDHAFASKSEWNAARGEKGGRFRDINEPFRSDYLAGVRAVLMAIRVPDADALGGLTMCTYCDEYNFPTTAVTAYIDHVLADGHLRVTLSHPERRLYLLQTRIDIRRW
jgi:hypothetical protein